MSSKRPPKAKRSPAKPRKATASAKKPPKKAAKVDRSAAQTLALVRRQARVLSVCGPFKARTIIELPTELAEELLRKPPGKAGRTEVVTATEREIAEIRKRAPAVAASSQAATAVQLAIELENPHNSATSKSMIARVLNDTIERLRELAPAEEEADKVDELKARRAARAKGVSGT